MVLACSVVCSFGGGVSSCPLVQASRLLWLVLSFRAVFPAFCPLTCFMLVASLANMALFRVLRGFLGSFGVRMSVCMD